MGDLLSSNTTVGSYSIPMYIVNKQPENSVLRRSITVDLEKGKDGWIVVTSPDLPAVVTQGKTDEEATRNALYAVMAVLEELGDSSEISLTVTRKY